MQSDSLKTRDLNFNTQTTTLDEGCHFLLIKHIREQSFCMCRGKEREREKTAEKREKTAEKGKKQQRREKREKEQERVAYKLEG